MHHTGSLSQNIRRRAAIIKRCLVHCFRDEYSLAVKDFTFAFRESRAVRKTRQTHDPSFRTQSERCPKGKRKKSKVNGQAFQNGTSAMVEGPDGEQLMIHPSVFSRRTKSPRTATSISQRCRISRTCCLHYRRGNVQDRRRSKGFNERVWRITIFFH